MDLPFRLSGAGIVGLEILSEDGRLVLCRGRRDSAPRERNKVLLAFPASEQPAPDALNRLAREYSIADKLDSAWAARPLELLRERGRTILVLEDPGGELLSSALGAPMEVLSFLRLAIGVAAALARVHQNGLIHKDIKPANILMNPQSGEVWLTGFGIASKFTRERQSAEPPESIAGTLAYMAPEQTGRMNRAVDSRSDLYSFGVTLYEMLTGSLPFTASDPMEWVHCHIAKQAYAPSDRAAEIPGMLSSIVMKLIAKTAEERYQTASGVEADLRRCLRDWERHGLIESFSLAEHDASDRLQIPQRLYGREHEIATLLASFDRVATGGTPELLLICGTSGAGKSSVVNELQKVLIPLRSLFAAGKFDQYKRDVPYATLAQAFQTLVRQILAKNEAEVKQWQHRLLEAVGAQGQLIVNLIPELEFIIGKQSPVADLPPQEAQNRLKAVFRRFLGAFARSEHPLALFLDDLQWLDAATLDLIEHLMTHPEVRHLLLVGAYRNDEVRPGHELLRTLDAIKKLKMRVDYIVLTPLAFDDVGQLIASTLHCDLERARPLTQLVHQRTGGNPFFTIQFVTELAEEGLLKFDPVALHWKWEINRIHAKSYAGNVVNLMTGKLRRLSGPGQEALKQLACLGSAADTLILNLVLGGAMYSALEEAVHAGLAVQQEGIYKFLHDRIQQAAYSLIPNEDAAGSHLCIGRLLLANLTADQVAEHLFEVAGQLNRGAALLIDRGEKAQVATIDLRAGRKAKAAAAFTSAYAYFSAGTALLEEDDWNCRYELTFSLWLERAECAFLISQFDEAEQLTTKLLQRAASKVDEAAAYHLQVQIHVMKSNYQQAVATALTCLRQLDIELSAHPTQEQVQVEYERVWKVLNGRSIESLMDLPLMTDPALHAAMRVLSYLVTPSYFFDHRLWCLLICRIVQIGVQHGTSGPSALGYVYFGFMLGGDFHRYGEGYRFATLACDLIEKHGFIAGQARFHCVSAAAAVWTRPIVEATDLMRKGIGTAIETGDPAFACYSMFMHIGCLLARSDSLDAVWRESGIALDFAREVEYADAADIIVSQQRFVATMQGRTSSLSTFSDAQFDEAKFEAQLTEGRMLLMICWYWILKLEARFLSGNYDEALAAADRASRLIEASAGLIPLLDYFYYTALTLAALYQAASAEQQQACHARLEAHREQLSEWAENCPPTFADKHALVSAEIARLEGRDADAMRLYEQAIGLAREHGFVQNEGVAHEVAARFYSARGSETSANAHLRNARHCYLRWGAEGKVRQLDRLYPHLADPDALHSVASVGAEIHQLDFGAVVKASQALSGEIELPRLIDRLMTIAVKNAGADHGLLILPVGGKYLIQAEARTTSDQVGVTISEQPITGWACPESIVRYVIRTHESVILDDASRPNLFSADDYLRDRQPKSILCLPLIKQRALTGILLLENALASHAFTPARIAVLELLAAQAAISLENTRLYSDLQEREAKVRRLVDSNIIGILIIDLGGRLIEANDAFLGMLGYERDDLVSGRMRWTDLTPPEWLGSDEKRVDELKLTGTLQPFEKEYFHKDGKRVPALVGVARFEETGNQAVAFVIDLSERKRGEAELAHANRIATMGQLSASIAHEVNQPLAATLLNAQTAVRWLGRQPPDLEKTRQSIDHIIDDSKRAADIVSRIRDFSKKAPVQKNILEINATILGVMGLTRAVISENGIQANMRLSEALPLVLGDRIQLQQVILNLIMNAVEAMSGVGKGPRELLISTSEVDSSDVLVTISDTGPGLPEANPGRIFDAFYTTKASGLGMGLSICRSIVEAHGGRLWATPNQPHGAVFCITLPIREELENPRSTKS